MHYRRAETRPPRQFGWVISVEDWELIRRLVPDGIPQRQVARLPGIGRSTVERALASDRLPKYELPAQPTSFAPFEGPVRALLAEHPAMPATVIAERVEGLITWFRENVRRLRPGHRPCG
ncbi:MAG: helix-turn-helix domain-containing protein [Mycetocola sp.]